MGSGILLLVPTLPMRTTHCMGACVGVPGMELLVQNEGNPAHTGRVSTPARRPPRGREHFWNGPEGGVSVLPGARWSRHHFRLTVKAEVRGLAGT